MSIIKIIDHSIPHITGYSIRSNYIISALNAEGVNLKVFTSPIFQYKNAEEKIDGVDYFRSSGKCWMWFKKIPIFREILIIKMIINCVNKNWNPEIKAIHAHSPVLNGIAAYFIAKKHKKPFIYEIRALWEDAAVDLGKTKENSIRYKLTKYLETIIAKKANRVVVICEGLKSEFVKRGINKEKIAIVVNGVDSNKFVPTEKDKNISEKYGLADSKILGFIGTFFKFEGLEILIKSAKDILDKRDDIKFLIVGSGAEEPEIKRLISEMGLNEKVILTGRVKHEDINKYYSVIDILIYPRISKRITEMVTPLKPLEAMAFQKVVIGSDVGGIKELVNNGKTGLLFKSGDSEDLTQTILSIVDNDKKMAELGKTARNYILEQRKWSNLCKGYVSLYKELGAL